VNNVNELRTELSAIFQAVKNDTMEVKKASELANIAGKMISSAKAQIEYYAMRKEKPKIAFLSTRGNSDESV
jgi:hypothetical protein